MQPICKDTQAREVNSQLNKSRFTIMSIINMSGTTVYKNMVIDKSLTRGLKIKKELYSNKDKEFIRLTESRQLHCVTKRGYITRPIFMSLMSRVNAWLKRHDRKILLTLDNLSSHYSNLELYKKWRDEVEKKLHYECSF